MLYVKPVRAEGGEVFVIKNGAGVKLSSNGLRFVVKMDKAYRDLIVEEEDVKLHGYIAPVEEFDKVSEYKDLSNKVGKVLDESLIYEKEGYYYANLAMTNLDKYTSGGVNLYAKSFSATFYIEDTRSGSPVYTYAEMAKGDNDVEDIELQNRTQYKVVNSAFLDGEKDYESQIIDTYGAWFGSEDYPIVISNEKEYDAFVAKLQNSEFASDITGKHVFVKQGVSDEKGNSDDDTFANVAVNEKIGHAVTYNDGYKVLAVDFVVHGEDSTPPADPTRSGFKFVGWSGVTTGITADVTIYATWKPTQGDVKDIGNMKVYGVTRADGAEIKNDSDVIGQKVSLMGGTLGDGAYYPGDGNPTDKDNTANQSYLAFDGNYGFGDYFVADFTGKNMPTLAFFANNYNNSIFYDETKNGVVVSTGLTLPNGLLFTEGAGSNGEGPYCTSVFDGAGLCMWGPHMIYSTSKNNGSQGVLLHSNEENVALGRANLVDGKKYRIIMGMEPGDDASNKAIKLVYLLYDLDNDCIVESKAINSYNFFADGWANAGQTRDDYCKGSIVAYGHFGTAVTLDKVYGIYEDSHVSSICESFGMTAANNVEFNGDSIVLGAGSIGNGANYVGPNANELIHQSYLALNGNYGLDDYIAFDFTGKNMPEIAFFAKNYNDSMYYQYGGKQGIVFVNGITQYNGEVKEDILNQSKQVNITYPYMINNDINQSAFTGNSVTDSKLARANLVDETQYRVIIGFKTGSEYNTIAGITLMWQLYDRSTNELIEANSLKVYGFFTGSNADVGNMSTSDLVGSIVLYGKFGTTCTIDKLHGVFENTDINTVAKYVADDRKTVTFVNWDGTELYSDSLLVDSIPEYLGATPTRPADFTCSSYTFTGWDKELSAVTENVTYTAIFEGTFRTNVTTSGGVAHTYGVEQTANKIVLKASGIGSGASYNQGAQVDDEDGKPSYVHQSYLALNGDYGLGDYVAFDFTGKNMPEIAFFAKNYDDSMYANGFSKQGIVVVTGITTWKGELSSGVNGNGTIISYGYSHMIEDTAKHKNFLYEGSKERVSALGRANLVDETHYRVIMGFVGGSGHGANGVTLHWYLYNLDTQEIVEQSTLESYNFFDGSNSTVNNMTLNDLVGSIVLYGKFGATLTLDKVHGVFENTDISTVAAGLSGVKRTVTFQDDQGTVYQQEKLVYGSYPVYKGAEPQKAPDSVYEYTFAGWDKQISIVSGDTVYTAKFNAVVRDGVTANGVTTSGDSIILGDGNIGNDANYTIGQNASANGFVTQSYYAIDGEYGLGDFIVFDFTGKNMPEVMFFAENYDYDTSMYYSEGKQGVVVASGITFWNNTIGTAQSNNTKVGVSGPFGAYYKGAAAPYGGNMLNDFESKLARANLVDGTKYRIIMGISRGGNGTTFVLNFYLYNLTDGEEVEKTYQESWAHYTGTDPAVGSMTLDDLVGSIVLYGKFYGECTIDKLYGVYEDTNLEDLISEVIPSDQGGEFVPPTSNAPDYSGYTDQFDFYAYSSYSNGYYEIDGEKYYVGKNLANLKHYSLYGEAGMTIYFPQNSVYVNGPDSIPNVKALIDDLAKVGIHKTIVQDSRILHLSLQESAIVGSGLAYANNDELDAYIYECVKDYASYPGVYGIQLGDEPKYACLSAYSAVYNSIKRVNQKYGFNLFIQYNLNPLNFTETVYTNYYPESSGTHDWDDFLYRLGLKDRYDACVTRYTQYINDFLDAMQPDSIMYDDYPLRKDKNGNLKIHDTYIHCLQIVAKAASDKGIKFYHVTQSHQNNAKGEEHKREVTENGAKWLNNILLGFGAKQLAYYTYYTRGESNSEGIESYVDGKSFVDYNGNPTELYYWMQKIMANDQKFAPTIMQFDYKGSKVYGSTSADYLSKATSSSFAKLSSFSVSTGSALVTELYDDENDNYMYMAMNVLDPDATNTAETVQMTFSGYTHVLVYVDGVAKEVALTNGVYTATLNNGDAVYVIPYNN